MTDLLGLWPEERADRNWRTAHKSPVFSLRLTRLHNKHISKQRTGRFLSDNEAGIMERHWSSNIVPIRRAFCKQAQGNAWSESRCIFETRSSETYINGRLGGSEREKLRRYASFILRAGLQGTHDSVASDEDSDILQESQSARTYPTRCIFALWAAWMN